jgi:imidazolonepropionase-like amidohydrolase
MTMAPATILGLADRVGSLLQGRDADLVAFDGDPIDLTARLIAVAVDGHPALVQPNAEARN